ncbi:neuraminidase-like domain-containing protein [Chitinophagaceae bacterium MMS25-I14]
MNLVNAPIVPGQKGTEVSNLQEVLFFFLKNGVLSITDAEIINAAGLEMQAGFYGSATMGLLGLFLDRTSHEHTAVITVDDTIADLLNVALSEVSAAWNNVLTGKVTHPSGIKTTTGFTVDVYMVSLENKILMGTVGTDDNGVYVFPVNKYQAGYNVANGWQVRASTGENHYYSEVLYNKGQAGTLNVLIDADAPVSFVTEFSEIITALQVQGFYTGADAPLSSPPVKDVAAIDISDSSASLEFLVQNMGEARTNLVNLVRAYALTRQMPGISPELLYGLFRQNISADPQVLFYQPANVLKQALVVSITNLVISNTYNAASIDNFIATLKSAAVTLLNSINGDDASKTATFKIIKLGAGNYTNLAEDFLAFYYSHSGNTTDGFWEDLVASNGAFGIYVPTLKTVIALAKLCGNNAAMVTLLFNIVKDRDLDISYIARTVSSAQWSDMINTAATSYAADFFYPDDVTGTTDEEKTASYAALLTKRFAALYPTQSVQAQLRTDESSSFPVLKSTFDTFVSNNPAFDFRTVSIMDMQAENSTLSFTGVEDKDALVHEIATVQRLMNVTADYSFISALAQDGLTSSVAIVQQSPAQFAANYAVAAGSAQQAQQAYTTAQDTVMYSIFTGLQVYSDPGTNVSYYVLDNSLIDPNHAYADWRTLFGSLDGCNCSQCTSVYSPAAYMTDILHFLKLNAPTIHDELIARRPDIKDILLNCKNTNTPVPHIDIVNELLEDMVSTGNYVMYARQTDADANYQRAIPEYINTASQVVNTTDLSGNTSQVTITTPYVKLKDTIYSWALPYNFYKRQVDTHLDLAGIKSHELPQRFNAKDQLHLLNEDTAYCASYLGLSVEEKNLIVSLNPGNLTNVFGFLHGFIADPELKGQAITYSVLGGSASVKNWADLLTGRIDIFLQQTGLSYTDLLHLLDCYTLNRLGYNGQGQPYRIFTILKNDSSVSDYTCDLSKLKIDGIMASATARTADGTAFLELLPGFVRMAKALGWTFYELDRAIRTIKSIVPGVTTSLVSAIDEDTFRQLAQIKYLSEQLRMSVEDVCTLRSNIENLAYRDYTQSEPVDIPTQFQRIFYNPLLTNIKAADYPFTAQGVVSTTIYQDSFYNHLSGIFHVAQGELEQILDGAFTTSITSPATITGISPVADPNFTALSKAYRQVVLLKALKLSVSDWEYYSRWISNSSYYSNVAGTTVYDTAPDPFSTTLAAIRFTELVKLFKGAGISHADVEYLLRDNIEDLITDNNQTAGFITKIDTLRAGLFKKWYPAYDADNDDNSKALQLILESISDADKASKLVGIIERVSQDNPVYTNDDQEFVGDTLSFFMPADGYIKLTDPLNLAHPLYIGDVKPRRQYVYDMIKAYIELTVLKPYIYGFIAKEFRLDEDVADLLLDKCIQVTAGNTLISGYDALLDTVYVNSTDEISRLDSDEFTNQFTTIALIDKAARFIAKFGLGYADVQYLWIPVSPGNFVIPDIPVLSQLPVRTHQQPVISSPVISFSVMANMIRWMQVRAFTEENMIVLYEVLKNIQTASKSGTLDQITSLFKTNTADIKILLGDDSLNNGTPNNGTLNVAFPTGYTDPKVYQRIIDCLEMQYLLPASMAVLADAAGNIISPNSNPTIEQQHASQVIQIVKAQYDDKQWLDVVQPVNDKLRMERRDAMVAYLLAFPPVKLTDPHTLYQQTWVTPNDIYETLMVDIEMNPCMASTRVLLATNTIQVWIDRVLMGLEHSYNGNISVPLTMSKSSARQWSTWRRLYRVWEANRKIFLYPENWIEPELRDDKSPFFLELEKFLNQNEVTKDNVEDAYLTYLERLDQVAHLDIIAMYRETNIAGTGNFEYPNDDVLHVFGRTKEQPHIYFYRKRAEGIWSAWEKMDVQIDGDHFVPVLWRGRLRFYWLVFTKDQVQEAATKVRSGAKYSTPTGTRWKIQLAWTEYKNNKWLAKQLSKDALYSFVVTEEDPISLDHIDYFHQQTWLKEWGNGNRNWFLNGTLDRQQRERINFYCKQDTDGKMRFEIVEKVVRLSPARLYNNIIYTANPYSFPFNNVGDQDLNQAIDLLKEDESYCDVFPNNPGFFIVNYNGVTAVQQNDTPDVRSLYNYPIWMSNRLDLLSNSYHNVYTDYHYEKNTSLGYAHYPDNNIQLLNLAPDIDAGKRDGKYLVFPRKLPENYIEATVVQIPYFFYKDYNNTFFVEKLKNWIEDIQLAPGDTGNGGPVIHGGGGVVPPSADSGSGGSGAGGVDNGSGDHSTSGVAFSSNQHPGQRLAFQYRFHNFKYSKVDDLLDKLYAEGIDGLLDREFVAYLNDAGQETIKFDTTYQPVRDPTNNVVDARSPKSDVDFSADSAYSMYNWELFFHIPLLIANKLMQNQQFEEARRWYQFVFNPTNSNTTVVNGVSTTAVSDFWNFQPFYDHATDIPSPAEIMVEGNALRDAVNRWANDPFNPHLIARTRISAYMKNTVMKYLDNLIAWGDNLFATDTRENINEATLLYVLAAQMLGRRPLQIPARAKSAVYSYANFANSGAWNSFSDILVQIESILLPAGATALNPSTPGNTSNAAGLVTGSMFYFCLPQNDYMLQYWDTLADRLFKIRNCQNIDGVERELALFDPPIDPALLVKAAAAGISIAAALADTNAPIPQYRFNVLSQKASELAQEVKGLGSQLLSALEKKDAEMLALLRSSQEIKVLDAASDIKQRQVDEAQAQIDGLTQQQLMAEQRQSYYQGLVDGGLNPGEQLQLDSMAVGLGLTVAQGTTATLASLVNIIPEIMIGAFSSGVQTGGEHESGSIHKSADVLGIATALNNQIGSMAGIKGGYARRKDEWNQQLKQATIELAQLDKQMIAAQIRLEIAQLEQKNHELQRQNAYEMDAAMHDKYTNEELYSWMTGQISFTYFQTYKLAVDIAKKAERCYRYELNLETSSFIQYGYWDSLKKGLMSGEQLIYDIKRMELSYFDLNKRQLELTKHVSLAALDPDALMALRTNKTCTVDLPEWLFDMDYPGQHMRRIKSVSLSIPCVAGPYTTISCKLSLLKSKYRKNGLLLSGEYTEQPDDLRFVNVYGNIQSIATSSAQNDSGLFEFNFRDERYLPFEGAGAISTWRIELPAAYAQFDYNSISDLILHVKYTALDSGAMKNEAVQYVRDTVDASAPAEASLFRMFSLRQEFSDEWHDLLYGNGNTMTIEGIGSRFPYLAQMGDINVTEVELYIDCQDLNSSGYTFHLDTADLQTTFGAAAAVVQGEKRYWKMSKSMTPAVDENWNIFVKKIVSSTDTIIAPQGVKDIWMVVHYTVSPASATGSTSGSVFNGGSGSTGTGTGTPTPVVPDVAPGYSLPVSAMLAWWKADAGVTLDNNNLVTAWHDQTEHGNTLAPISTNGQPSVFQNQPSVLQNWKNGKPALVFNGAQALRQAMLNLPAGTEDVTVFMVGEKTGQGSNDVLFELSDNFNTGKGIAYFLNENGLDEAALNAPGGGGYTLYGVSSGSTQNLKGVYVLNFDMSNPDKETSVELNGKLYQIPSSSGYTSVHSGQTFSGDSFNVGSRGGTTSFAHFNLAELIIVPSKATDDERLVIKNYLADKYKISVTPGLKAWWKADADVTVSAGQVTKWGDVSGNGYDLIPVGSSGQITLETDAGNLPFIGISGNCLSQEYNVIGDVDDFTIFYVGSSMIGRGRDYVPGAGWSVKLGAGSAAVVLTENGQAQYNILGLASSGSGLIQVMTLKQNDTSSVLSLYNKDGELFSTDTLNNKTLRSSSLGIQMGTDGTNNVNGGMYEAMVYNRVLTASERSQVLAYLNAKYNQSGFGLVLPDPLACWKADTGVVSSGGLVQTWNDSSGNGYNLTAPTSSDRPSLITVGGTPAVSFSNSLLQETSGVFSDNDSFTIVYAGSSCISRGIGPYANFAVTPESGNLVNIVLSQFGDYQYTLTQPSFGTSPVIVAVTVSQASSHTVLTAYDKNGQLINTMTAPSSALRTSSNGIAMGQWWNYQIADGITYQTMIYNRVLTTTEMIAVLTYLRNRYPSL